MHALPYLKPTRSNICCTLIWFMPTALIGTNSLLKLPPVMALRAGLSSFKPFTTGHSLLPLAKWICAAGLTKYSKNFTALVVFLA